MLNFFKKKETKNYKFKEPGNTACFSCIHVLNGEPILFVSHDQEGSWQFLCGKENHPESEAKIVALEEISNIDQTVNELYEMPLGVGATRASSSEKWKPFRLLE